MRVQALLLAVAVLVSVGAAGSPPADDKIQPSAYREAARGAAWATVKIHFRDGVSFD
jgi:hypothetical protein